ncbi:hypothetical protein MS3_00009304 [Schistosoma haematobium]|uniref:Uncharacterized protein n=1 Tax=Schistosoma haematobium TaxID=6185 RepID=A0A6A5D4R2_SCHHA|nr:hypothetical protein MS3_00009304 [Schistosoma haematobium]KAH9580754.1 hypothetical protein MS3_00009304 [Schistosoma haematobium]
MVECNGHMVMLNRWTILMVTLFTYYLTCQCVSTWLIRSGEPVQQRTDFPFIALLVTYASMCTGSLVSTRAVLTAVGLHGSNVDILCLLQISFLSLSEFEQRTINHQPSEIKVAPDYYPVCQLKRENKRITKSLSGYDMAIITLTNSVNLETGIKVVSLATESDIPIPESIVYMVGYGQDVKDSDPAGRNGGILKKGSATVMACRHKTYGNPICVKPGPNSKQIAGPGDSGGPLLFSSQGPIIGVASSGVVLSSLADLCVEYSSVARMLRFILFNI